jgi:hypothetical protein
MGKKLRRLVVIGSIVASLGLAAPASATTVCAGTQQTAGVCVDVTKGTFYEDCVYVGSPPCIPVSVPGVVVQCWGWIRDDGVFWCV